MRVTDRLMFDRATRDGGRARSAAEEAIGRASTGLRVQRAKDDPAAAAQAALERARSDRLDAVSTVAARASDELASADSALASVSNAIARARELAVQLSNGTYGAAERAGAAGEVRNLLATSVSALNAEVGGRYVLAGDLDGTPPFDPAGNYAGDAAQKQIEIAPGLRIAASVRADVAVKGAGGGVDVLTVLSDLATALAADDLAGVRAALDPLTQGTAQVARARADAGAAMSALDTAVTAGQEGRDRALATVAQLTEADPVAAASELMRAQRALEAALTATAKGFELTLLDKLR